MPKCQLLLLTLVSLALIAYLGGCQSEISEEGSGEHAEIDREGSGEHREGGEESGESREAGESREGAGEHGESGEGRGEHAGEAGESHAEEGEESGERFTLNQTYDGVRNGVRMILRYSREVGAFVGTVENITEETVPTVRVEVHLSNGVELGPTPRADLAPGQKRPVTLSAEGNRFEWWTTHAESGVEIGHGAEGEEGGEGRGEHAGETGEGREGRGEHAGETGEGHAEEEESGERFAINQTYDGVRKGVRMILRYSREVEAFVGTVENITEEIIPQVRVEVHLSNGTELGPTPRADLAPGQKRTVTLPVEGNTFTWWTTHAESG